MAIPLLSEAAGIMASGTLRFIVFEVLLLVVSAIFIWIGGRFAEISKASFMRSLGISVILAIIVPLLLLPFAGMELLTLLLSVVLTLAIIKLVFDTGWRKSLITWVFSIIAQVIVMLVLLFVLVLI